MINKNRIARFVTTVIGPILNKSTRSVKFNNGLTVFLFHEVTDDPSEFLKSTGMWVSREVFRRQVNWIQKNFQVIPITDLLNQKPLPRNAALITFDDSWAGMVKAIEDFLLPREVPVCLFLNFGTVATRFDVVAAEVFLNNPKTTSNFERQLIFDSINGLTSQEQEEFLEFQGPIAEIEAIRRIGGCANVTISNHLFHHFDAMKLTDEDFIGEFRQNDKWIQSFNKQSGKDFFAFPFGTPGLNFEDRHLDLLAREGVKFCFSGTSRRLKSFATSEYLIPRIHFSPEDRSTGNMWWACYKNQILQR